MISVCLTTFNGEKYIVEQLRSILSQLESADEVIISDDNSVDCTLELIKNLEDKRVKIFINNQKRGIQSNVENALNQAKGDIIFLSDQSDLYDFFLNPRQSAQRVRPLADPRHLRSIRYLRSIHV